ncbi:MAG: FxsA family protein, partial [Alphaproteobacteria bacterium]|nr:FxsA family protein [Alphaproteobacteria bacterium]
RMPLREVFDGLCLLVAGALLLTPGFVTDLAGAMLLTPPVRLFLSRLVARYIVASGQFQGQPINPGWQAEQAPHVGPRPGHEDSSHDDIIDVDFEEVTSDDPTSIDHLRDDRGETR